MKSVLFTLVLLPLTLTSLAQEDIVRNYIAKYKDLAIEQSMRTGVPVAIILAQGIRESGAGTSMLAVKAHNHFGVKCGDSWDGPYILHDDESKNERFRAYESDSLSYVDYANILRTQKRYSELFKKPINDYKSWAYGLKNAGYASDPQYPQKLIKCIEKYNLDQYDKIPESFVKND